jgi:hypothetical protein
MNPREDFAPIRDLQKRVDKLESTGGGGSGTTGEDKMEARVARVEESLASAREDISSMKATLQHLATKADVQELGKDFHEAHVSLLKWLVGTVIACGALAFAIARYIH